MCNLHEPSFEALLPRPGAQQVSRHKQQKQDGNFEIFGIKYKFCIFPRKCNGNYSRDSTNNCNWAPPPPIEMYLLLLGSRDCGRAPADWRTEDRFKIEKIVVNEISRNCHIICRRPSIGGTLVCVFFLQGARVVGAFSEYCEILQNIVESS